MHLEYACFEYRSKNGWPSWCLSRFSQHIQAHTETSILKEGPLSHQGKGDQIQTVEREWSISKKRFPEKQIALEHLVIITMTNKCGLWLAMAWEPCRPYTHLRALWQFCVSPRCVTSWDCDARTRRQQGTNHAFHRALLDDKLWRNIPAFN
jgi:hypothetical protein